MLFMNRYHGDWNKINYLAYQHYSGNQLGEVADWSGSTSHIGFQDKTNGLGYDYVYDPNGNLIYDYNKSITSITYNFLNLPNVVTITGKGTITYTYDAAGNKLQKTTLDQTVTPNKTTNYYYAGDFVYRNDTLEFVSHPEGRLRPVRIDTTQAISIGNLKYLYDYFLKDHLGSVRSVLTTEQQTDLYAATMETANATKENALFSNVSATAVTKPAGFSNDNSNQMASKLNGAINVTGNKRVGPSIVLKVMTGDTISISSYSWYSGAVQPPATGVSDISTDLLPLLTAGIGGENGTKGGSIPTTTSGPLIGTALTTFLASDRPYVNTRPKAFLNWMVVGEDFNAATGSPNHVNAIQIPVCNAGDTLKQTIGLNRMVVRRNGWIYIYLSNESAQDVYFDNLVVNLTHGPLVEQKDYYTFGLEIPGLCTKALKQKYFDNRMRYNGKELQSQEFSDSSGLTWDDYGARMYDPQITRWMRPDPLADKSRRWGSYIYAFDNPIKFVDPDGMDGEYFGVNGKRLGQDENGVDGNVRIVTDNGEITKIKSNDKAGTYTSASSVTSGVSTTKTVLAEASDVLNRTNANGGNKEENSVVKSDGTVLRGQTGSAKTEMVNGKEVATTSLPVPSGSGNTSIHSHITSIVTNPDGTKAASSAEEPGPLDPDTFKSFSENIIVGNLGLPTIQTDGLGKQITTMPAQGAVFFDSKSTKQAEISKNALNKIIKSN
jgi:RHS repeat-associated protein